MYVVLPCIIRPCVQQVACWERTFFCTFSIPFSWQRLRAVRQLHTSDDNRGCNATLLTERWEHISTSISHKRVAWIRILRSEMQRACRMSVFARPLVSPPELYSNQSSEWRLWRHDSSCFRLFDFIPCTIVMWVETWEFRFVGKCLEENEGIKLQSRRRLKAFKRYRATVLTR